MKFHDRLFHEEHFYVEHHTPTDQRLEAPEGGVPRGTSGAGGIAPPGAGKLEPWWVTGFIEGEGSFTYSKAGNSLAMYFSVRLPESDLPILTRLQSFFNGVGRIYRQKGRKLGKDGGDRYASYYRVNRVQHLAVILKHFEGYPLEGEKAESFRIWRDMVNLKLERQRRGLSPELLELAAKLSASSPRGRVSAAGGA